MVILPQIVANFAANRHLAEAADFDPLSEAS